MPRIKKTVVQAPEKNELPTIANQVANSQSKLKRIESDIEQQVQKIRLKYQAQIDTLRSDIQEGTSKLEAYALDNRDEFEKKKSQDVVHGIIGFRISTPAVKLRRGLSKKICSVLDEMGFTQFIRTKQELDKEKILSTRQDQEMMKKLENLGVTVEQKETFYFEPKEEEVVSA